MSKLVSFALLSLLPLSSLAAPPNIVFIVADDLGWTDLGSFGSSYYETPNIDKLRATGMKFTNAYACPNCAPTRAALMSGQYAPRTGVYTVGSGARGLEEFRTMIPVPNRTSLDLSKVTIAELLKSAGYVTAHMGKWHLGNGEHLPTGQGFDLNIAGNERGAPSKGGYFSPYSLDNLTDGPKGEHLTDRLSAEAVKWITENKNNRFFLYLPYYAVHTPIMAKQSLIDKYSRKKPAGGHWHPAYAAMIDSLDQGVGRVLDALDSHGIADETLVIFYGDNGGVGSYARAGVAQRGHTSNAPLRGGKGMLYEGGVRVPMIVRYPGVTQAGATCHVPVVNVDFYPTLADVSGAKVEGGYVLDGTSFLPLLKEPSGSSERPPIYWHFPGYLQGEERVGSWRTSPAGAIRKGRYKLIEFFEGRRIELYDLQKDISERNNLAESMPKKAKELHQRLIAWRESVHAPMPVRK